MVSQKNLMCDFCTWTHNEYCACVCVCVKVKVVARFCCLETQQHRGNALSINLHSNLCLLGRQLRHHKSDEGGSHMQMRPFEASRADETLKKKGFCLVRPPGWLQMYTAGRLEGGGTLAWWWRKKNKNKGGAITCNSKVLNVSTSILWMKIWAFNWYFCINTWLICLSTPLIGPQLVGTKPIDQTNQLPQRGKEAGANIYFLMLSVVLLQKRKL